MIFLGSYLLINIILVPFAQGIYCTHFLGYVAFFDAFNSATMIAYSKGDLEYLLDTNVIYSFIFLFIYYLVLIYIMHSGFHMAQTDALKSIVKRFSIKETDVIDNTERKKATDLSEYEK